MQHYLCCAADEKESVFPHWLYRKWEGVGGKNKKRLWFLKCKKKLEKGKVLRHIKEWRGNQ